MQPGLSLRVLRAANRPLNPLDTTSWELPGAIADADLVHLHMPFTRSNELALIVAKQQHKPICVTDHGGRSSILGQNLDILQPCRPYHFQLGLRRRLALLRTGDAQSRSYPGGVD